MKLKVALSTFIGLLIGALLFTQLNVAAVLAVDNNPITSAITSAINDITAAPTSTPAPEPPMTAPLPNPTPTPEPITGPVANPTPEPGPVITPPVITPTPQPTPQPSPTPAPANPNDVTLSPSNSSVKIEPGASDLNINVPANVTNPELDLTSLKITSPTAVSVILPNSINIVKTTNLGNILLQIPSTAMISGPEDWSGKLNMPSILDNSTITAPNDTGMITSTTGVIEIGANDTFLTLDKAVRILIPGQAGKLVGYQTGTNFSKITLICSADSQAVGDNLEGAGNCYINVGSDLVIWTRHFTKFVTYTQSTQQNGSSGSSVLAPIDPKYGSQAPICGDSKPTSAPRIISAESAEPNSAVIVWSGANDPVSYYLIAYGTKSDKMEYGNPNVGDKNTRSYKVKGLSGGQTYFFKVRSGNGCMPGEFSNEVKVLVSGSKLNTKQADGFKAGVLSTKISTSSSEVNLPFKPITSVKLGRVITDSNGLLGKIVEYIIHLFKV